MAAQGSGGAFEISQRMTAMIGWGATTGEMLQGSNGSWQATRVPTATEAGSAGARGAEQGRCVHQPRAFCTTSHAQLRVFFTHPWADFREDWTWDQAAETYAFDQEMADKLR